MVSRGRARVSPHGLSARGRSRRRGHRPDRLAGEDGLPERCDQRGQHRQQRDKLNRRLPPLVCDAPHGGTIAFKVSRRYACLCRNCAD
jgi:hypothetical protein